MIEKMAKNATTSNKSPKARNNNSKNHIIITPYGQTTFLYAGHPNSPLLSLCMARISQYVKSSLFSAATRSSMKPKIIPIAKAINNAIKYDFENFDILAPQN